MRGKKQGHRRHIKVKLSSLDSVNTVLRNSRKLKGDEKFEAVEKEMYMIYTTATIRFSCVTKKL